MCVYVSVTVHWVELNYDFIVILQTFYVVFIRVKKKSDRFTCLLLSAVSYCRQIYIETAPYIYRNWFPHTVHLVLSTPLPSAAYASLDLVRTQTKSTQMRSHSAVLCPPSGTGCQTHSKMQKTLQLSSS